MMATGTQFHLYATRPSLFLKYHCFVAGDTDLVVGGLDTAAVLHRKRAPYLGVLFSDRVPRILATGVDIAVDIDAAAALDVVAVAVAVEFDPAMAPDFDPCRGRVQCSETENG